jgi:hypothetical protein
MNIPSKVKIGIYEYDIVETDKPLLLNGRECSGIIHYNDLKIEIKSDMPKQKKVQSLWHEIFHGITKDWDVNLNGDEEDAVDRLATGVIQVLKDNPLLLSE